jgi:Holliday junction resolvase RusA-like endonuclease
VTPPRIYVTAEVHRTRFVIPGEPIAWQRVSWWKGRGHTDPKVKRAKEAIGWAYKAAGGRMLEGPVYLGCEFALGERYKAAHLDPRDLDNMVKLVKDALEGVAYPNDRRVIYVAAAKVCSREPRTWVVVSSAGVHA